MTETDSEHGEHEKSIPQDVITATPDHTSHDDASDKPAIKKAEEPTERPRLKTVLLIFSLTLATFLAALDQSIISTALPTITEHFQSQAAYTWTGSAYTLAMAATTMVWGKVSDIFGRKPVLLLAIIIFSIGSLIAALSINAGMLITSRAIQGCGGGGLNVLAVICIGDLSSTRQRGTYMSFTSTTWAIALSLGPIIGGLLSQRVSWRWCFYINLPLSGIAFTIIMLFLDLKTPKTPILEGIKAIDWVGSLLSIGGTLTFLFGLMFGGDAFPWNSATVICLIIFGLVIWILFLLWEVYLANYPILNIRILASKTSLASFGVCACHHIAYISANYYLPLYFQAVLGAGPILSGVATIPFALSLSVTSVGMGIYIGKTGEYHKAIRIFFILTVLGIGLLIDLDSTTNWAKIIIFQIIIGVGVGPNFLAPIVALHSVVPPRDVANATSAYSFIRNLSSSISIVFGQVVFQNEVNKRQSVLTAALGPELAAQVGGGAAGAHTEIIKNLPPGQRDVVHTVLTESLRSIWIMYTGFAVAGLLISFLIGKKELSSDHKEIQTGLEVEKQAREERMQEEQDRKNANKIDEIGA